MNTQKHKIVLLLLCICISRETLLAQANQFLKDSVYSNILGENRPLLIYLPEELASKRDTTTRFPLLYVLDGDTHFLSASGMINELAETSYSNLLPKMIIVCIPNTKRTRDLTPFPVGKNLFINEKMAAETGGAENFISCIEKEIIPHVASKYPVTNYRALVGHSFGGIFALQVLSKHKHLFDDYVVIDPSMWYGDRKFAQQVLDSLSKNDYAGKSLFLAIANTTNQADTTKVKYLKDPYTEHQKSIIAFNKQVRSLKYSRLTFTSKYYPEDDHQSIPFLAMYDGLRFIFKEYHFSVERINEPSFKPSKDLPEFYKRLSQKIKFDTPIPGDLLEVCDMYYVLYKDEKRSKEIRQLYEQLYPKRASNYYGAKDK